ncbi:hypothetical protein DFP72DRAFT_843187 [Ephemerocybe angulata]|uniref:Uncharacterized protein n=1 Tax=Ephemerocybe angulata TaxID=980116 RepID=A0A8H6M9J2_9AGAR|nr:hypothetical protein DFP72DRAFT_843187 [Tulosesus angulatus]
MRWIPDGSFNVLYEERCYRSIWLPVRPTSQLVGGVRASSISEVVYTAKRDSKDVSPGRLIGIHGISRSPLSAENPKHTALARTVGDRVPGHRLTGTENRLPFWCRISKAQS